LLTLNGGTSAFDYITVSVTGTTISEFKQDSINLGSGRPALPEPATWAMMLLGFGGIGMAMRRSKRRSSTLLQVA
jgi:hypothetical protein